MTLFVKEGYKDIVLQIYLDTEILPDCREMSGDMKFGRGRYLSVPISKKSAERFVVKDCRHGGLFGKLFGKVFWNANRAVNELCINEITRQKGVPSAEIVAMVKRKLWGPFYRADFISKEVTGAIDIRQFLEESSLWLVHRARKEVISAVAKAVKKMHDAGIYHADLHLKNILVRQEPGGEFVSFVIDLDKSVVFDRLDIGQRMKNLLRLDRSAEKLSWHSSGLGRFSQNRISGTDKLRFFMSYMSGGEVPDTDWKKYVHQYRSVQYFWHKFWWYVLSFFQ